MTTRETEWDAVQGLLDAIPLALALFDADKRLARANQRYAELTDLAAGEMRGRSLHDAWPNALAGLEAQIADVTASGEAATRLLEFRGPGGTRTAEVTIARFTSIDGGWVIVGLDVTEREELRRTLARSVEELETIFATIPESVRVFAAGGEVVRFNSHARNGHHEVTPMSVAAMWQADRPRGPDGHTLFLHEHPASRALSGESVRNQQIVLKRAIGETTLSVNAEPLRDEQGHLRGAVAVERDVTEHVELVRELAEQVRLRGSRAERLEHLFDESARQLQLMREARERERRLAAVGQLAAGVMHDVNNVLNPILAAAYLIENAGRDQSSVKEYAQRITRAAEMGVARLARLRQFIRQDPHDQIDEEVVDVAEALDEVLKLAAPMWEGRESSSAVSVQRDLASGVVVRGMGAELRAAALNLVHNALDAMPHGGTLTVTSTLDDGWGIVEVRDTGTGMPPDVKERVFEPFFTTKGARGTGLGLAEVYGIVRRHRGVVGIESSPGAGTLVRMRFPLATTVT